MTCLYVYGGSSLLSYQKRVVFVIYDTISAVSEPLMSVSMD